MNGRHTTVTQYVECSDCEWEGRTTVTVDDLSGVAAFDCPECGRTREPIPGC